MAKRVKDGFGDDREACPHCGLMQHVVTGEALRSLVGVDSLTDENGFQSFMKAIPAERWEAAARILSRGGGA